MQINHLVISHFAENAFQTGWFLISVVPSNFSKSHSFLISVMVETSSMKPRRQSSGQRSYKGHELGDPEKEEERTFSVHQKMIRLNTFSKTEGFYYVSHSQRVYPTLLAAIQADPSLKFPLRCTTDEVNLKYVSRYLKFTC